MKKERMSIRSIKKEKKQTIDNNDTDTKIKLLIDDNNMLTGVFFPVEYFDLVKRDREEVMDVVSNEVHDFIVKSAS